MTIRHDRSATLGAGLIVQYLHGELSADVRADVAGHLEACPACARLAAEIEARTHRLSDTLRSADFEAPPAAEWTSMLAGIQATAAARRRNRRLRIAAGWIAVALASGVLVSAPLRAWLVDRWTDLVDTNDPAVPVMAPNRFGLAFTPVTAELTVSTSATQADGAIHVRFTEGDTARVSVTAGTDEALALGTAAVRITNRTNSTASYFVEVPKVVKRVTLRIGERPQVVLERSEAGARSIEVDLRNGVRVRNPMPDDEP